VKPAEAVDAWAARGRRVEVPGAGTSVWEAGEGPPVVCIHGVPVSAFEYRALLPELAARGLRGVAFDLPGLGLADRPRRFDYRSSALGGWCRQVVDALGLDGFHLVVHDIGGPIGFDLARRVPDRVLSLTALNTWVRVATFKRRWFMEPYAHRGIGHLNVALTRGVPMELFMRWKGVATAVPSAELRAHALLLHRGDGGRAFLKIMRSFERTREFEASLLAALAARRYPAQVVWGELDTVLTVEHHALQVQDALGLDTIHRLPGKHYVQTDCPIAVAERLKAIARAG
jgi:haloalkane dehalogenase